MADIPGFPSLNITEEHKKQAAAPAQSIKDANPHADGFLQKIHDGIERGEEATAQLSLAILFMAGAVFL